MTQASRLLLLVLAVVSSLGLVSWESRTALGGTSEPLYGDANCDGAVNSIDAAFVLQHGAGLLDALPCPSNGDVNGDGIANSVDAALVLQFVGGLLDTIGPGPNPERLIAISAGSGHTCALNAARAVKCWGLDNLGQLGNGATTGLSPNPVATDVCADGSCSTPLSGVAALGSGALDTCVLTTAGGVKCWGYNQFGQLGNGSTIDSSSPVDVIGLTSNVLALTVGAYHACALTSAGAVKCWGYNVSGQLGDGTSTNRPTPVGVVDVGGNVVSITAGGYHTCALLNGGAVKCWGDGLYGQLGDGGTTNRLLPVDALGLEGGVSALALGHWHSCAVTNAGGAKCWGSNSNGQVGDGTTTPEFEGRLEPVDVLGLTSGVTALSATHRYTCALTASGVGPPSGGGVKCWGYNGLAQLGDGTTTSRFVPADVLGLTVGIAAIATGEWHACALTTAGGALCWGYNAWGELGAATAQQCDDENDQFPKPAPCSTTPIHVTALGQ